LTAATGGVLALVPGSAGTAPDRGFPAAVRGALAGKAIAREAGLTARHNEDEEFAAARAQLARRMAERRGSSPYKGVLLEGLEVWLIVIAWALRHRYHQQRRWRRRGALPGRIGRSLSSKPLRRCRRTQ